MNIVFVMNIAFPYGQAFSSRARHITKLLCLCGHHVHIIAPDRKQEAYCEELAGLDYSVEYVYAPQTNLTLAGIGTAKPYMKALAEYEKKNVVDMVFSSEMTFVSESIRRFAQRRGIPYIIEQCEWYDMSTFLGGRWNPYYREHIRQLEKKNRRCDGVLVISRLLYDHYVEQGVSSIRIPTILDVQNTQCCLKHKSDTIKLVFAGSLGKGKENIAPILQAIALLGEEAGRMHFDIYGANDAQVLENVGGDRTLLEKVRPFFTAHGRVPQPEVEEIFRDADVSIFIRPDRRSSHAGFPTKLAESMAVGTPVITNDTGDIGLYLKDGENGYLLKAGTAEELAEAFRKLLAADSVQRAKLRENTRKTAENSFDYRQYQQQMTEFVNAKR